MPIKPETSPKTMASAGCLIFRAFNFKIKSRQKGIVPNHHRKQSESLRVIGLKL
jgi:hypothetical protein